MTIDENYFLGEQNTLDLNHRKTQIEVVNKSADAILDTVIDKFVVKDNVRAKRSTEIQSEVSKKSKLFL